MMESLTTTDAAPGKAVNGSQVSITPVAAALGPAEDNEPASSDSESEDQSLTSNQHDIKQQRRVQNAKFEDLYAPQRFHHGIALERLTCLCTH